MRYLNIYHRGTNQLRQIQYINKLHLDLKKQTKSTHNLQFRIESNKDSLQSIGRTHDRDAPLKDVTLVDETSGETINRVLAQICKQKPTKLG